MKTSIRNLNFLESKEKASMLEQFGISVSGLSHSWIYDINELNLDIIQVPLHRGLPDEYVIDQLADTDTHICGKLVPDPKIHDAQFFKTLLHRYKGRIKLWDFGGEPETRSDQPGCRWPGSAKEFVALYKEFWLAAKLADPGNVVGGAGFISPTFNGLFGNEDRFAFAEEMLAEGFGPSADFLSLNIYLWGYSGLRNAAVGIWKFRELVARYGLSKVSLIVSECGVPCAGDPRFLHIIQTPEMQAASLVQCHVLFDLLGIDYSIWYTFKDLSWGIIDQNGFRRPAYLAFKNMIRILKGLPSRVTLKALPSKTVEERWLTDNIYWCVFSKLPDQEVHVVWTDGPVLLREIPGAVKDACDMYGSAINGSQFILDACPKYFSAISGELHSGNFLIG